MQMCLPWAEVGLCQWLWIPLCGVVLLPAGFQNCGWDAYRGPPLSRPPSSALTEKQSIILVSPIFIRTLFTQPVTKCFLFQAHDFQNSKFYRFLWCGPAPFLLGDGGGSPHAFAFCLTCFRKEVTQPCVGLQFMAT